MARRRSSVIGGEFSGVGLPDARLNRRVVEIAEAMARRPDASFPDALGTEAALEGGYRFFNNPRVTPEAILDPHHAQTVARSTSAREVLAIHDTSLMEFSGESPRRGLGPLRKKGKDRDQGFLAHATLAVSADGTRDPLGLLALSTLVRSLEIKKRSATARRRDPDNEARRWRDQIDVTQRRLAGSAQVIHVMDREADSYELLSHMQGQSQRFVIRVAHDRVVSLPPELRVDAREKLRKVLSSSPVLLERDVELSRRRSEPPSARGINPNRDARTARLAISAATVIVSRSEYAPKECPATLRLHVVRVIEVDAPSGEKPVEWILLTTDPIDTPDQVARIVDHYRVRWMIEEFFKALKTGCRYEERQLESLAALLNALAVLAPVAWQMLRLRHLARSAGDAPAQTVLTPTQLKVLRSVATAPLPPRPTLRDALLAIARLGGHLKRNGEPGWLVLMRGARDLAILEAGWIAGQSAATSRRQRGRYDQS